AKSRTASCSAARAAAARASSRALLSQPAIAPMSSTPRVIDRYLPTSRRLSPEPPRATADLLDDARSHRAFELLLHIALQKVRCDRHLHVVAHGQVVVDVCLVEGDRQA